MKTALWVLPVSDLGGVARHVLDVVTSGLPGYRIVVLLPEGAFADLLRSRSAAVLTTSFGQDVGLLTSVRTLRATIRTLRPDVVHSHLAWADLVVALGRPAVGGPKVVTTEHGIARDDLVYHGSPMKARLRSTVHHLRLRRFDAAIAVSGSTRAVMQEKWHPTVPVVVIPNGVDPVLDTRPAPGMRVATISRLAPEKRLDAVLRAFAQVRVVRPEATLVVAGAGPLADELRALATDLGIDDAVSFPGHVDATELMERSDVLAQLSVWENASYSLLDACVRRLGVVASPVGGNPEILPGRCLVDPTDPAEVAARIVEQGSVVERRPELPDIWPTVSEMCAGIVAVYDA